MHSQGLRFVGFLAWVGPTKDPTSLMIQVLPGDSILVFLVWVVLAVTYYPKKGTRLESSGRQRSGRDEKDLAPTPQSKVDAMVL